LCVRLPLSAVVFETLAPGIEGGAMDPLEQKGSHAFHAYGMNSNVLKRPVDSILKLPSATSRPPFFYFMPS